MLTPRPVVIGALACALIASGTTNVAAAEPTADATRAGEGARAWERSDVFGSDPTIPYFARQHPGRPEPQRRPAEVPWLALSLTFTAALGAGAAGTARLRARRRHRRIAA
jgi:hypothetical protein